MQNTIEIRKTINSIIKLSLKLGNILVIILRFHTVIKTVELNQLDRFVDIAVVTEEIRSIYASAVKFQIHETGNNFERLSILYMKLIILRKSNQ